MFNQLVVWGEMHRRKTDSLVVRLYGFFETFQVLQLYTKVMVSDGEYSHSIFSRLLLVLTGRLHQKLILK